MKLFITTVILLISCALLVWTFPAAIEITNKATPSSDLLEQRVVEDIEHMKSQGVFPDLSKGLLKVEIESSEKKNPEVKKIADAYYKFFSTNPKGQNILKIVLVQHDVSLLVLMSLENAKTQNRFWELSRTLKLR